MSVPFAQIEPTSECNLRCTMCERGRLERTGHMPLARFEQILDAFDGLEAVKLQGLGEPMLNPDFPAMMAALKRRGIRAYTALNATCLNAASAERLVSVADRIEVSIDSADPAAFARIRRGAKLETVIEGVRLLRAARHRRAQFLELSANGVVHTADAKALDELFALVSSFGLDRLDLNVVQFWDVGDTDGPVQGLNAAELEQLAALVETFSRKWSLPARLMAPEAGYENCPWYGGGTYVSWEGNVTPCCQRPDPHTISFGNLLEESFETIWNSDAYRRFREALAAGRPPEACRTCTLYYSHGEAAWTSSTCQATTTGASSGSDRSS